MLLRNDLLDILIFRGSVMMLKKIRRIISVTAIGCVLASTGVANAAETGAGSTILFAGADAREDTHYPYVGVIHHFSGDILSSGFLVRALAYQADYEYDTTAVPQGNVDGRANGADLMIGYQKVMNTYVARGYIGLDYEDHDLSPDNVFDSNRGSDTGVKVQVELETDYASPKYASLVASYGTAKDRYWARLRGGHDFSGYVIGPEVLFTGDDEYDESRIGAFVIVKKLLPVSLSVSAGYSDSENSRGGGSAYLSFEVSRTF